MAKVLKLSDIEKFAEQIFSSSDEVRKGAPILQAILEARSLRLTDLAQVMPSTTQGNYKAIHRFLKLSDPLEALWRLYQEDAPFIIGDPTEVARPQAKDTEYVGTLKDKKTKGFWLLLLATPYRGRAIPFHFITYSSRTIAAEESSRNLEHRRALSRLRHFIGDKPLVLDREFSYGEFLTDLIREKINFVIRLNVGSSVVFTDEEGKRVSLDIAPGQRVYHRGLYYQGKVKVNVAGYWQEGLKEPLWVVTNLACEAGLKVYAVRMKIEETFRDVKSLLGLGKIMNKSRDNMEKMVAMLLIAYTIGLLTGEEMRDEAYGRGKKMGPVFGPLHTFEAEAEAEP